MTETNSLFLALYNEALKGNCMFRKYAAAIVKNGTVIGMGYARTPQGAMCSDCDRMKRIEKYGDISEFFEVCPVVHAELCAILNCEHRGDIEGSELFLLGIAAEDGAVYDKAFPCPNCYRVIQYCGISTICVFQPDMSYIRNEVFF